ncbi:hypothetical protein LTR94_030553, partial [Friedmanniomyces endolithicus]
MPDNGIKIFGAGGHKLDDDTEDRIAELVAAGPGTRPTGAGIGRVLDAADALDRYLTDGTPPPSSARVDGSFAYPEIRVRFAGGDGRPTPLRSFGRLVTPGDYRISVTKPAFFADYLVEQLTLLIEDYDVTVEAVPGKQEIPYPYVIDPGHALSLDSVSVAELARWFPTTELAHIGDEIADGLWMSIDGTRPLALFDGLRTDFSLARLRHYTGTPPEHVQRYVL